MAYPISQRRFMEFSSSLEKVSMQQRIPYMGVLELTYRCNQSCVHCYCNLKPNDRKRAEELKLDELKRILDEAKEEGCLWMLFTGGEIFLREDFWDIYLYALQKGMLVELFTNGTLIDEDIAKRLADWPPVGIEISLYGSNASVHESISQIKDSFKKVMDGINWLKKYKIPFSLKTMIITLNYPDLKNMQKLAKDLSVDFKFDCLVWPRIDGEMTPISYRLPITKVVDLELEDERDFMIYKKIFANFWKKEFKDFFICTAGINSFNVNPYGILSPCAMFLSFQYPLKAMSFRDAWKRLVQDYGNGPNEFISKECRACNMVSLCPSCPPWSELEAKRLDRRVDYLCKYALLLEKEFFQKLEEVQDGKKTLSEARD